MDRHDRLADLEPGHPSVYCMTDRELADEYSRLTGALVQVPTDRNPAAWWQWRSDLQERLKKERSSPRYRYVAA
jgi:hypothetical protein